jgi:uncharacterized protein YkwD
LRFRIPVRFLIAFPLLLIGPAAESQQYTSAAEWQLFNAANRERQAQSLPALKWSDRLATAARRHAHEMANRGTISHEFPGEASLPERVTKAGVPFSAVAENVAEASGAARIHELWMHSSGHRANILDKDMDSLGVGVVQRNGQAFAVEDFARVK